MQGTPFTGREDLGGGNGRENYFRNPNCVLMI